MPRGRAVPPSEAVAASRTAVPLGLPGHGLQEREGWDRPRPSLRGGTAVTLPARSGPSSLDQIRRTPLSSGPHRQQLRIKMKGTRGGRRWLDVSRESSSCSPCR